MNTKNLRSGNSTTSKTFEVNDSVYNAWQNMDEGVIREYCRKIIKEEINNILTAEGTKHKRTLQANHNEYNKYMERYYKQTSISMFREMINTPLQLVSDSSIEIDSMIKKISSGMVYAILSKI